MRRHSGDAAMGGRASIGGGSNDVDSSDGNMDALMEEQAAAGRLNAKQEAGRQQRRRLSVCFMDDGNIDEDGDNVDDGDWAMRCTAKAIYYKKKLLP